MDEEGQGHLTCLDTNHSHFILVDDGTHGCYGVEIPLRTRLEKFISEQTKERGGEWSLLSREEPAVGEAEARLAQTSWFNGPGARAVFSHPVSPVEGPRFPALSQVLDHSQSLCTTNTGSARTQDRAELGPDVCPPCGRDGTGSEAWKGTGTGSEGGKGPEERQVLAPGRVGRHL